MKLKDKVELYENFLGKIAAHDVKKEMEDALVDPHNAGTGSGAYESKYPFAFGMMGRAFEDAVSDAQYALNQGTK